ncbi:MAG: phosphatidylglycerol lysyltransferase domain-containing protein, partial [Promethearchaeota archaeon]
TLKFKGALLCVNEKCAAYTFGEMLNSDTLVIHIEKAHMEYEGAYQAINNLFLKNCCKDVRFVNREQDLGIPGLRRAKESYKPIHMVEKSVIYRK